MNQSVLLSGKKIDEFILTNIIGKGAFGEVFEAQNITTKQTVAIKSVPKSKLKEHNGLVGELLQTEVQVLLHCNNENVVKLIKYLESENNCYLVMEFCNQGDFEKLWKKRKIIPEQEAIDYLKQLLNGMKGLHELNVIHRDLKLPNILIDNGVIKIADLGFAKRLNNKDEMVQKALGTLGTMAPEVIEFKSYGTLVDMFSLGAVYYQMLFGSLPFSVKSYDDFLKEVKTKKPDFNRNGIKISQKSQDLLTQMLQYDPRYRMKWNVIYDHPLFANQEGFKALNQATISSIAARQVDMHKNNEIYKNNQQQFEQINNQNMFDQIKKKGFNQKPQQVLEEDKPTNFNDALQLQQQNRQQNAEIDRVVKLYLGKRNTLLFLARVIDYIHRFQHSQNTNVYLPAFMLLKKLLTENSDLINKIKNHKNLFMCTTFGKLYENPIFLNFYKMLEEESQVIICHFNIILSQMKDIFSKMQNPNQLLLSELSIHPTNGFEYIYKDTLLNYYSQLQEEQCSQNMINEKTNLCIFILDSIAFDNLFKIEVINIKYCSKKSINDFQIENYFEQFDFLTSQEKDKLIEEKFMIVFS